MSKIIALRSIQTAYLPYFIHDRRTAFLHLPMIRSASCSPRSQQKSLHRVECLVTKKDEVDKAARKRSGAADHEMSLSTLQFTGHLHPLFGNESFFTLDGDRVLNWNTVKQSHLTASALLLVYALLSHEAAQPLRVEQSAVER